MTLWLTGLAIGAAFGWCWGFTAGRRARCPLPAQSGGGQE